MAPTSRDLPQPTPPLLAHASVRGRLAQKAVACPSTHQCTAVDQVGREVTFNPAAGASVTGTSLTASAQGTVGVKVGCPAGESSCTGTITLKTLTAVSAARARQSKKPKAGILTLAAASFKVAGGQVATVKLHLSAKARRLLAHTHVLRVRATIVSHDPAGAPHTTQAVVTIRPANAKRKG